MRLSTIVLAIAAALSGLSVSAGVAHAAPTSIPYTGVLQVSGNNGNSPVNIEVRMFDSPDGNVQVWPAGNAVATFPGTQLRAGRFSIRLGSGNQPLDASVLGVEGRNVYLQITVNGTPLSPRQQLLAVPYALDSESAALRREIATLRQEVAGMTPTIAVGPRTPHFRWDPGSVATYTRVPGGPSFRYTPERSGTYRVHTDLHWFNSGGANGNVAMRMQGAAAANGPLTLVYGPTFINDGGGPNLALHPQAIFNLTAGVEYEFFVEAKSAQWLIGILYNVRERDDDDGGRVVVERMQ